MTEITYSGAPPRKTAAALGYFDGLHLGHIGVISAALARKELSPAVFTFGDGTALPKLGGRENIISFADKRDMLEKIGIEYLCAPDFSELRDMSDEDFVREILIKRLNAGFVCCGNSFRFGKGAVGTPQRLKELCGRQGIDVEVVGDVCMDGEPISSGRIRALIKQGDIAAANRLLGYELRYKLIVIHGNEIGRQLSYPTINQILPENNILPRFGVYAAYAQVHGRNLRAVTNIGVKPTIEDRRHGSGVVMETHILGFDGDLYGEEIAVSLCGFIRPERKFSGREELKRQIAADTETALEMLGSNDIG